MKGGVRIVVRRGVRIVVRGGVRIVVKGRGSSLQRAHLPTHFSSVSLGGKGPRGSTDLA